MSQELKMGPAGVRGIYEKSLTTNMVEQLALIYADVTNAHKVLIGCDTRRSREPLTKAIVSGLRKAGCHIVELGVVPTPTLAHAVRQESADGGIMLTASHNPMEWNGLKFFTPQGIFISPVTMEQITDHYTYQSIPDYDKTDESIHTNIDTAISTHQASVFENIDVDAIRNAGFKIVVDSGNGAGTEADKEFFKELNLEAVYLNDTTDGLFTREPEPLPEHLHELGQTVKDNQATIGVAQDPDADRLVLVDENGTVLSEEYTLALSLVRFSNRESNVVNKRVVTNLSTSRMIDDIGEHYGYEVLRTKIGEVFVAEELVEEDAAFGGEGNGGVIWPEVGYVRDSFSGMALILEHMAVTGKSLSQLVEELPHYERVKDKQEVSDANEVNKLIKEIEQQYSDYDQDHTDGVKIDFENGWLHVRASNTEPIVRFFAEATTKEEAEQWIQQVKDMV